MLNRARKVACNRGLDLGLAALPLLPAFGIADGYLHRMCEVAEVGI